MPALRIRINNGVAMLTGNSIEQDLQQLALCGTLQGAILALIGRGQLASFLLQLRQLPQLTTVLQLHVFDLAR